MVGRKYPPGGPLCVGCRSTADYGLARSLRCRRGATALWGRLVRSGGDWRNGNAAVGFHPDPQTAPPQSLWRPVALRARTDEVLAGGGPLSCPWLAGRGARVQRTA